MNLGKKRNVVRALLQHLCEGCFQQRGCHILVDAGAVGDVRGEGPDDCAAPRSHLASERPRAAFWFGPRFPTPPRCRGGTRQKAECRRKCSSHLRLGQRRASLNAQDNKMQIASRPRGRLLAPTHSRRSLADQLVVVIPREGRREGGREGGGRRWRWRGDRRISLRSAALSFTSVCWLSSGEQIETNRICRSSPPLPHCNMAAQPGLTVIRGLRFTSSVPAKRVMMRLGAGGLYLPLHHRSSHPPPHLQTEIPLNVL